MYQTAVEPLAKGEGEVRGRLDSYTSRFGRWNELASVRRKPQRSFESSGTVYFPPELYPVAMHPLVTDCGDGRVEWLLLRRLYGYLDFTSELESSAVIPVATAISRGRSGLQLPERMKADAFKIVTDEAWHAQVSYDFAHEIELASGVPQAFPDDDPPAFVGRLGALREELPHEIRGVEAMVFAIVSETLISGILSDIPRDGRLPRSVREQVRDHAEDEGRHHVYFRSLLHHLWAALTAQERRAVGPQVPAAIHAFLEPDYARVAQDLRTLGLTSGQIEQVLAESWPKEQLARQMADASTGLVRYFAEVGALDDGKTRERFEEAGLMGHTAGEERENGHCGDR
ncbi:diiron oxygenase [Streptomyces phyllanthi]|uniref:Diiron oxygenase n=1 Tax=Streptomyces phyllanthi TaxID=1803180 RepID=A0A5N8VTQ3_9ACTN|nr:diiron oxygenase [Streptomyces phyllanthi]MPY38617.1 diiron oxygenase [Streptomyces phyllanthi]